jgi:short subunit dehydrogenase-like uncharacterized protein
LNSNTLNFALECNMTSRRNVLVYGAYGHTGRFVADKLRRRGWTPVLGGRNADKLAEARGAHKDEAMRVAPVEDPESLVRAAQDCVAILNCAGPFEDTAAALIESALGLEIPYLDITGEPGVVAATFERFADRALAEGVVVAPAFGFYGALGDLLACAAMRDWQSVDTVSIAYALDGWKPTAGTLAVMKRMTGARPVSAEGKLGLRTDRPAFLEHVFPEPAGRQTVMADYPGPESVLIPWYIPASNIKIFMAVAALRDLQDPNTPGPVAADESGRSAQTFMIHVEVTKGPQTRSAWAQGRDIYATTAPVIVEAMVRVLSGRCRRSSGVVSAGQMFDAQEFLESLASDNFRFAIH